MYQGRGPRPITRASVYSRSQIRSKKDWDDRFSIERMPQYDALRDKHCQAFVSMIKKKLKKPKKIIGKVDLAPGRIRRRKIRKQPDGADDRSISRRILKRPPKGEIRINRATITDEMVKNLEEELAKSWIDHNIPQYHTEVFHKYCKLLPMDSAAAMMAKEIDDLKKGKAPIQKVSIAIIARENCLEEIEEFRDPGIEVLESYIARCTHKLHSLRMLSLNAVECIVIWREQMLFAYNQCNPINKNNPSPGIAFLWDDLNYLVKMKSDTDFLNEHILSRYFNFSEKNDPFLVIPSCAHTGVGLKGLKRGRGKKKLKNKLKSDKFEVPLDNSLMQRIKASEVILDIETKDTPSEAASPIGSKKRISPTKDIEMESDDGENANPNSNSEEQKIDHVPKRQNLFEIRKQKKESSKDIKNISPNQTMKTEESPSKSPQKQEITKTTSPQKAEPEPEEEDDEEMFDYELLPLELHANEAIDFLKNYSNKIDSKFNVTYNTPEYIFEECFKGNNAQCYKINNKTSSNEIDGILIYSGDSHFDRINLHHISTINKKGFESAIQVVIQHIWTHETVKEIRIGLHHYDEQKNGKTVKTVDPEMKVAMKNKLKWKNILNVKNDRILVMGAVRDKSDITRNELDDMLSIKSALCYSVSQETIRPQSATNNSSLFFIPSLCLSNLIQSNINTDDENLPAHHKSLTGILNKIKENKIGSFPSTACNKDPDLMKAIEPASANDIQIDQRMIKTSQKEYHCNVTKVDGKLLSIDYCTHSIKSTDYAYLRIKTKDMVCVKTPTIDTEIFFMPVGNKSEYGLLVFKKPTGVHFSTSIELYEYCKDITSTMSETETSYSHGLYLPCFKKVIQNEKLDFMHGFQVDQENNASITDTVFNSEIAIHGRIPKKAALKFEPNDGSYIIDDDYIFVLTHPSLEEEAKIPFICGIVAQDDWIVV
ncbi:unnamed protein product [Moneuplotes crassus]|uniref:Uncharacterized protein n=1 Tax=Euplotes crassus TaxID=5936 RepID=A0AAD1Y0W4_EUPCR|nr:unnamed protein product [Moneuplotes crassus]